MATGLARGIALTLGLLAAPLAAQADLVLRGGTVVTVDDRSGDVAALAIRGDHILAAGSEADVEALIGPGTRVIELDAGAIAVPGFIEGHGHFVGLGESLQVLDLRHARSWSEIVALVREAAARARPGEWILGRGWHQEKWEEVPEGAVLGFPTHASLSAVTPANPVCLTHASGHACICNAAALRLAGIDAKTRDPEGGDILRDAQGEPIGVLRETAQDLVQAAQDAARLRRPREEQTAALRRAAQLADRECARHGVTSFQDAGSPFATIDVLADMAERGELGTRLWVMIRETNARLAELGASQRRIDAADHHLTVRAIKRTMDGALGSRSAWMLAGYADAPDSTGLSITTVEDVRATAELAAKLGFQLCVHAIGDRANREVLDLFEEVFAAHPELQDPRWRIEHAQHLAAQDVPRFAQLGVIASMQGVHCTSDAPYVIARLGEERAEEGAYVWRRLLDSEAVVSNGTDAPVESVDPIACFIASVTRRCADGTVFYGKQRMTRREALRSYTMAAAYAAFEEGVKGSLTPGKLADVVVLSRNILTVPDDELAGTEVLYTIVGGKIVYQRE